MRPDGATVVTPLRGSSSRRPCDKDLPPPHQASSSSIFSFDPMLPHGYGSAEEHVVPRRRQPPPRSSAERVEEKTWFALETHRARENFVHSE
jgi:hypothetical protein